MVDLARQWRCIPVFGPIRLEVDLSPRALAPRGIAVREWRAASAEMRWPRWAGKGPEPGVVVALTGFDVRRGVFDTVVATHALVSRHALARRFQRWRQRDDAAVLADLDLLVGALPDVGGVPTLDGIWVGERAKVRAGGRLAQHCDDLLFREAAPPHGPSPPSMDPTYPWQEIREAGQRKIRLLCP